MLSYQWRPERIDLGAANSIGAFHRADIASVYGIRTRGIVVPNDIIGAWRDRIVGLVRPPAKRLRG